MTIAELIAAGGGSVLLLLTLVQIAPIRINPWSTILRTLGKLLNAEESERMDRMESDLRTLQTTVDRNEQSRQRDKAVDCRARIVHFGDEIQHNVKHSQEHFNSVLYDISVYESYCKDHPDFPNEVAVLTIELVKETYRQCKKDKSFL